MENFYDELDLRYPEIAILTERFYAHSPGKESFYLPVLMPYMPNNNNTTSVPVRTKDLQNKENNIGLSKYTTSSTIKIKVPDYIAADAPTNKYGYVLPGTEFIVVFIGGDINKPRIIGGNW